MRLFPIVQYIPLWIFLGTSRYYGQTNSAWAMAFQYAGLAAAIAFLLTLIVLKNDFNRIIAGANSFLIFGGASFFTKNESLLNIMDQLRTSALILFIGVVALLCTLVTPTGVFEKKSAEGREQLHSFYFVIAAAAAFAWSYNFKTDIAFGGVLPFVSLLMVRYALKR